MNKNVSKNKKSSEFQRQYRPASGIRPPGSDPTLGARKIQNMYYNYESGALESFPGFRRLYSFGERIHTLFSLTHSCKKEYIYIHAGVGLYRIEKEKRDGISRLTPIAELKDKKSVCLSTGELAFISDGEQLFGIDREGEVRLLSDSADITGCTLMAVYDGRLFLSGNPSLPGVVIYSSKMAGSLPESLDEGKFTEGADVISLLGTAEGLFVFTAGSAGGIIKRTSSGEAYPVSHTVSGMTAKEAIALEGRLILLTPRGLYSLSGLTAESETKIKCLSEEISGRFCRGDWHIGGVFLGYILLYCGSEILLWDTASPGWYLLNGIGSYEGDSPVYRYSSFAEEGYSLHPLPDTVCHGEAMSLINESGKAVYYENCEEKYSIYPTEERSGGSLYGISCLKCESGLIWFGSECGALCLFNNDKMQYTDGEGFIDPSYYSFAGHAPEYLLELFYDDCGKSGLTKSTVPGSFIIKFKAFPKSSVTVKINADGEQLFCRRLSPSSMRFSDMDFENLSASTADAVCVSVPERRTLWHEKQIILSGGEFCSPFGIISLGFRYKTHGTASKKLQQ